MNSDHTHVRSLLLEQLESRSLLAAGFFSWSGSHPDPHLNGHVHSHPDSLFRGDRIVHAGERHNQRPVEVIRQVSLAPLLEIRIIQRPVVVQVRTSPQVTVSAIQQTPMITPDKPPKSPEPLTSSVDTAIRQDDELGVPDRSVGDTQDQSIREIPAKPSSSALRSSGTFTAADDASEIDVPPVISNAASEMHRLDPLSTPELRSPSLSDSIELGPPQHQRY